MPSWRRALVAERSASRPRASDACRRPESRRCRGSPCWLKRPRLFSGGRGVVHHPVFARRRDVQRRIVLRLGVDRPRPPVPVRSNRRRRVLRANLAAPARLYVPPAGDATFVGVVDRPGRAPLMRFRSPSAHSGRGALSGGCQPSGRSRFGVCAAGPRALRDQYRRRPPVRFCARGEAGRGLLSVADVRVAVLRRRWSVARMRRLSLSKIRLPLTSLVDVRARPRSVSRSRRPVHISRRRLASACPGAGHSQRPFLARGVPDPQFPGLRDLTERFGFFPLTVRRRSWGSALRRFAPACGWTRGVSFPRLGAGRRCATMRVDG